MSSTELAIRPEAYPPAVANIEDTIGLLRENVGPLGFTAFDLPRVATPAGGSPAFTVPSPEGPKMERTLSGIVIFQKDNRVFWREAFGSGGGAPPDCRSSDGLRGVGDPGGQCTTCPHAQFSTRDGKRGAPECSQRKILFVLPEGAILPIMLSVAPTSLKAWKAYGLGLLAVPAAYHRVVTTIGLEPDKNADGISFFRLSFKMSGKLPVEMHAGLDAYRKAMEPLLANVQDDARDAVPEANGDVAPVEIDLDGAGGPVETEF